MPCSCKQCYWVQLDYQCTNPQVNKQVIADNGSYYLLSIDWSSALAIATAQNSMWSADKDYFRKRFASEGIKYNKIIEY